ncbi:hypothetical protein [Kribbella sancticallisti]
MFRTVPADAVAIVRAYPPMVICFAGALALTALVFDVFYLIASPGLALAAVYTVPVLAGLIAGLVAAADDVELERRVLLWTIAATVAVGITNIVLVAMISAMRRTGPSDWGAGGQAILFAACTVLAVALTTVVVGNLIRALGIEIKTKLPRRKRVYLPPPALAEPKPRASKEAAARAKPVRAATAVLTEVEEMEAPTEEQGWRVEPVPALTPPSFTPPPPKVIDLDEARPVTSWVESTGHADRRGSRARRIPAVPPSRRPHRPGRRPDR